ncbi:TPA: hypothetical protein ACF3U9_004165, partial [Vibrio parahaemolyticus]
PILHHAITVKIYCVEKAWCDNAMKKWQMRHSPMVVSDDQTASFGQERTVTIALPKLCKQNINAKLYEASIQENALLYKLINNRQQQLNAIATDLLK